VLPFNRHTLEVPSGEDKGTGRWAMGNSGVWYIDIPYNAAVKFLIAWAKALGTTYEHVNVWLFVVAFPLAFFVLSLVVAYQWGRIKGYKALVAEMSKSSAQSLP
jgi:hypothetical protein